MHRSVKSLNFEPQAKPFAPPLDWRDQVIYHVLVDRFFDSRTPLRALPVDEVHPASSVRPDALVGHQGGNLRGLGEQLDYIHSLGCTALWLSPFLKNRQEVVDSHGYGVQDFLRVDPRLGTLENLQWLVQECHKRSMYAIFDVIINHTGDNWAYLNDDQPLFSENGSYDFGYWRRYTPGNGDYGPDDAVWPLELQHPDCYKRRGRIRDMESATEEELIDGDFQSMKDLAIEKPDVLDVLIQCYKWWIAQTDCDGFRIDTLKHTDTEPAAKFCNAIREYTASIGKHSFFLLGEVIGDISKLQLYLASNVHDGNKDYPPLDACLNFPLHSLLPEVAKGKTLPRKLAEHYETIEKSYRDYSRAGRYFVNYLDNHDQISDPYHRFLHGEKDWRLASAAMGCLLTSLGIPCIYYGTEQAFAGGGDCDVCVREPMFVLPGGEEGIAGHFLRTDHPLYQAIARYSDMRAQEPALRYGRQYFHDVLPRDKAGEPIHRVVAYSRILDVQEILVIINFNSTEQMIRLESGLEHLAPHVKDLLSGQAFKVAKSKGREALDASLMPYQVLILKSSS